MSVVDVEDELTAVSIIDVIFSILFQKLGDDGEDESDIIKRGGKKCGMYLIDRQCDQLIDFSTEIYVRNTSKRKKKRVIQSMAKISMTTWDKGNTPKYSNEDEDEKGECQSEEYPMVTIFDILSSELILICIASFLQVSSLLSLSATNKDIRMMMKYTRGVWRTIDLSNLSHLINPEIPFLAFLRRSYVKRDCRTLILDGTQIDHTCLDTILLREMLEISTISLKSCPNLNGEKLIKLIEYIRRFTAPRPLYLKNMYLLGPPLFKPLHPSIYAPVIVATAGTEISTDLHSLQCFGKDHIEKDKTLSQWHLSTSYPKPCTICSAQQFICIKCHDKKTCVECLAYYCDKCEPHPIVLPTLSLLMWQLLKIDCHECGRLCVGCRKTSRLKCIWCWSYFCGVHEPIKPGGKICCEWCRNAGRGTKDLY